MRYVETAVDGLGDQARLTALTPCAVALVKTGGCGASPTSTSSMYQPSMTTEASVTRRKRILTADCPAQEVRSSCSRTHAAREPV